jgi:hypothetical protein
MRIKHLGTVVALALARDSARAQAAPSWMLGAQAIPVVTRADPTATKTALTEGYLTQPVAMAHVEWSALRGVATLNLEGLTLQRGELSTGGYGEGYVDRRHPHSYVHELLAGVETSRGSLGASFFAGRGFAPFGSDDPMMRPFEKYPVNHHLAQILERIVTVAAVRYGPVIGEAALFNGDEPVSASEGPNWNRFGDSWSARLTVLPFGGAELSGSVAHVESPEVRLGRGLDARKESVVARFSRASSDSWKYLLAEWARTDERDRGASATLLHSLLAEGAYCRNDIVGAARIERTDRPEEEPTLNPFRTPRPPVDLANLGVSRWTTLTVSLAAPAARWRFVAGRPFVEVARVTASSGTPPGLFDTELRYGAAQMWMFSAGLRLRAGAMHDRMGRYGVALPSGGVIPPGTHAHDMESHDMASHAMSNSNHTPSMTNRCSL